MDLPKLQLRLMPPNYAICSFPPDVAIPDWTRRSSFFSITKTSKEITIVCEEDLAPDGYTRSENWKCIKVEGSFDLDAAGILESIARPLAQNKISLYVISTYNTDYVLIHTNNIGKAVSCLCEYGHTFVDMNEA